MCVIISAKDEVIKNFNSEKHNWLGLLELNP